MSRRAPTIVVLGMMTKIPVAGVVWQTLHYLLGFRRLGFEVAYVESHARTPSMLMEAETDDAAALAATFLQRVLRRFDLGDAWSYVALHSDGAYHGLSERRVRALYRSAEMIVNLHGGTVPLPEHAETGRLVYVETDPVQLQVELHEGLRSTVDFLEPHCAFFTFGENYGRPGCRLPVTERFRFLPTRQPVVLDLWPDLCETERGFTTVGNWRQQWRDVSLDGETYSWSKDTEFRRVLELPALTEAAFELALAGCDDDDRALLEAHGFGVSDPAPLSADIDAYRDFIAGSTAEFTVAKDQNVRLRSGWFSDRSATYLASGRPVVTQDTAFGCALPTGAGLHAFSDLEGAVAAVEQIRSAYAREREAAREIARESFDSDVVLRRLLDDVGVPVPPARRQPARAAADLELEPLSRRPLRLPDATVAAVLGRPVPAPIRAKVLRDDPPAASIVVVTHGNLALTRLCLESIVEHTPAPLFEVVVVDNASEDGTRSYLLTLARRDSRIRPILNELNLGFPRACNQGLASSRGDALVLLNNDTILSSGWLPRLLGHLSDPAVGLVGPVTNRIGTEAEVPIDYRTIGELEWFAERRAGEYAGSSFDIGMPAMFCVALRRDVWERVGPLDEQFGLGTLEDDDYALRVAAAGYRSVCAEDVFVHHFGEASFGELYASGDHSRLIAENRRRFEQKWGTPWCAYDRRRNEDYRVLTEHVRRTVATRLPEGSGVAVVSRGDDELVRLDGRRGLHFPQRGDGVYAGHYPADSGDAIAQLEEIRGKGGEYLVLPCTGFWWLDHYSGLRDHLETRYERVFGDDGCIVFSLQGDGR